MKIIIFTTVMASFVLISLGLVLLYDRAKGVIGSASVTSNSVFNEHPALKNFHNDLRDKLDRAGRPGGNVTPAQFLATIELVGVGFFLFLSVFLALTGNLSQQSIVFLLVISALLALLGFMWLDSVVADRRTSVSRQFPYFMDMAVMSMEAGASFQETLSIYVKDNEGQPLSDDLGQALAEMKMGKTLTDALQNMNKRTSTELVKNALMSIIQGERMGTPIAKVLSEQSETIRFSRSQTAERLAEEIKIKMQGPAMLLLISILLLILGPAFIDVANSNVF
ncbi:MAG: tight adherence protein C [Halioglobus sp.]|jgi:tight adherence protein C